MSRGQIEAIVMYNSFLYKQKSEKQTGRKEKAINLRAATKQIRTLLIVFAVVFINTIIFAETEFFEIIMIGSLIKTFRVNYDWRL